VTNEDYHSDIICLLIELKHIHIMQYKVVRYLLLQLINTHTGFSSHGNIK